MSPGPQRTTVFLLSCLIASLSAGCLGAEDETADPPLQVGADMDPAVADFGLHGCEVGRWFFFIPDASAKALLPPGFTPSEAVEAFRTLGIPVPPGMVDTGFAVGAYDAWDCPSTDLGGPAASSGTYVLVEPPDLGGQGTDPPATQDLVVVSYGAAAGPLRDLFLPFFAQEDMPLQESVSLDLHVPLGVGVGVGTAGVVVEGETHMVSSFKTVNAQEATTINAHFRAWYVNGDGTLRKDFIEVGNMHAGIVDGCLHASASPYAAVSGTTDCTSNAGGVLMSKAFDAHARVDFFEGLFPTP